MLLHSSCATSPPVEVDGLALRRVVIYRNGVAYFEREGRVSGNRVSFRVRGDEVGDFLASFAVMEKGGSSVRAASFPLHQEEDVEPPPGDAAKRNALPKDPKKRLEKVVMELDGSEHDLAVGYIAEAPVWRPSYRLVLEKEKVHLQLWGIVQNLSGEDWRNTRLTLIADAPLALQTQLETPIIPGRPILVEGNEVMAVVPQSETSLAEAPPPPPAPAAAQPMEMMDMEEVASSGPSEKKLARKPMAANQAKKESAKAGGKIIGSRGNSMADLFGRDIGAARPAAAPSRTRNLAALAAVAVTGGATRYELPEPVTVPNGSATMLLLLDKEVPGESSFLFAPDPGVPDSAAHPFRVARFTNQTGGLLERGPLAFFGEGGFLGQGVIDGLPAGASATVPFALEQSLAVERNTESIQEGSTLHQIEMSQLIVKRQVGPRTRYTIKSGNARGAKLWIKHPRQSGSKLLDPPKDTEDNVGTASALVPVRIAPQATATIVLDERQGQQTTVDWLSPLAEEAIKRYLDAPDSDRSGAAALKTAFDLRNEWKKLSDETSRLRTEQQDLERSTEETRDNIKAIEKNKAAEDLRKTLTTRLAKASARLDVVVKRLIEVDLQVKEVELRFREAIKEVHIAARP
ncbi:MAG TPA: DUF4139 domain-containing protein [Polyangia bacterium]